MFQMAQHIIIALLPKIHQAIYPIGHLLFGVLPMVRKTEEKEAAGEMRHRRLFRRFQSPIKLRLQPKLFGLLPNRPPPVSFTALILHMVRKNQPYHIKLPDMMQSALRQAAPLISPALIPTLLTIFNWNLLMPAEISLFAMRLPPPALLSPPIRPLLSIIRLIVHRELCILLTL